MAVHLLRKQPSVDGAFGDNSEHSHRDELAGNEAVFLARIFDRRGYACVLGSVHLRVHALWRLISAFEACISFLLQLEAQLKYSKRLAQDWANLGNGTSCPAKPQERELKSKTS